MMKTGIASEPITFDFDGNESQEKKIREEEIKKAREQFKIILSNAQNKIAKQSYHLSSIDKYKLPFSPTNLAKVTMEGKILPQFKGRIQKKGIASQQYRNIQKQKIQDKPELPPPLFSGKGAIDWRGPKIFQKKDSDINSAELE
ncbi:MAG: hypothetical protein EZS28_052338, partial [Streblomastix strix]